MPKKNEKRTMGGLEEILKVYQAKVFGLLLLGRENAEDFRKVRALAISEIQALILNEVKDHYWDSLEKDKSLLIKHFESIMKNH